MRVNSRCAHHVRPTINSATASAIAGLSVCRCWALRLEVGDRRIGGHWPALPAFRVRLLAASNRGRATDDTDLAICGRGMTVCDPSSVALGTAARDVTAWAPRHRSPRKASSSLFPELFRSKNVIYRRPLARRSTPTKKRSTNSASTSAAFCCVLEANVRVRLNIAP
jgi:hypothetical protein